ncbi:bifunctional hydroxymethylpyrimidine kinase/phosphomethylpyrimidine kinase [Shouchella shacheensis]|uniref:bifunctional hydroxymethylpyrimidine kinase/phosphomethylpyrimidine kinase n=1 Tax=Shouchella shacheensis TaxID=1649580 RepID=UPI00073FFF04|nr:bifunctional hydroxymethylpyrimidine kinase/phosphomethylpyrimidine kinase [Shouchella shacheensis]
MPTVLTIAGSDSGGGAGIQADIKTCQELSVYTTTAITAITVQNTCGVKSVEPLAPALVQRQIEAVLEDIGADVVKTGMLVDAATIEVVAEMIQTFEVGQVVVDPVLSSTSGSTLLQEKALEALQLRLLPLTSVFTPNLSEAAKILEQKECRSVAEMHEAAVQLQQLGPQAVVLKGGHLEGDEAVDVYYDGETLTELRNPRLSSTNTHGTGCTFAAAIAAELAKGASPEAAVQTAKRFITTAISQGFSLGKGTGPTNHFAYRELCE